MKELAGERGEIIDERGKVLCVCSYTVNTWQGEIDAGHLRGPGRASGMGESTIWLGLPRGDLAQLIRHRNLRLKLEDGRSIPFVVQPSGDIEAMGGLSERPR